MAAAAVVIFSTGSSFTSISFYDKPSSISSCFYSLATIAAVPCNHVTTKSKSIKTLKLKHTLTPFSLTSRPLTFQASLAFNSVDSVTEDDDFFDESESDEEETDGDEQIERQPDGSSRIYVGNLPYTMINSDLAQVFAEAGRVVSSQVVYDRVTDRSRGFAFVIMASVEEAEEAIRMFNGSQIGGRSIKVNFPEAPRRGDDDEREVIPKIRNNSYQGFIDSPHKIYAGNLSWDITSQGLKDVFMNQPGLLSAKVIYDRDTGRSRGFGFVTFSSAHEAQSALDTMNGVEVEGRSLRVNLAGAERKTVPYMSNRQTSFDSSELLSTIDNSLSGI